MPSSRIAILLPAFNEAASLPVMLDSLHSCTESLRASEAGLEFVTLVVDDGSKDTTFELMQERCRRFAHERYAGLSRNFGKEAAISAGLSLLADADAVIIMDADGQHPLDMIAKFVAHWRAGAHVVYGVQQNRAEGPLLCTAKSLFYRLLNWGSNVNLPAHAGDFRLVDAKALAALAALPERNRYMKGLYAWIGFRTVALPYTAVERLHGSSHYSWRKLASLGLVALTAFTTLPLRLVSLAGLAVSCSAFFYGLYILFHYVVRGADLPGWTTLAVGMMFFSGIQLLALGMISIYIGRIFNEVKQRPLFLVDQKFNF